MKSHEEVRDHTRRRGPRIYLTEHVAADEARRLRREPQPKLVAELSAAGSVASALRRALREHGIDPKLARLVLVLRGRRELRMSDVAWELGVSDSTASRLLDRAERLGLIDKLYRNFDRRGTWARTTKSGRELRAHVVDVLASLNIERPAGPVHGMRANRPFFSRNE